MEDARLALTLVGPSAAVSAGYWFQFNDPNVDELGFSGISTSIGARVPWPGLGPAVIDPAEAIKVVSAFFGVAEPLKSRLRLALSRLNQAFCEPPHGDRALDLAIVLESLLAKGSQTEITYQLALHAALLTDGPIQVKKRTRAIVSALYDARSRLIHDGALPNTLKLKGVGHRPSGEVVELATTACADILRIILFRGDLPDWEELELASAAPVGAQD